jgi:hypothetical protein
MRSPSNIVKRTIGDILMELLPFQIPQIIFVDFAVIV